MARRPRVRRHELALRAAHGGRYRRGSPRARSTTCGRGALGARYIATPHDRRHAQPLRRQRPGPLRAVPGDRAPRRSARPGGHSARRCSPTCAGSSTAPGAGRRAIRSGSAFRGTPGHHLARRSGCRDGERVRELTGTATAYAADASRWLGERPRRERLGRLVRDRRRHHVPALPAAPGREHRRARWTGRRRCWPARWSRGRTATAATGVCRTCGLPGRRRRPLRPLQRSAAVFRDNVQSYSTVEPAIDLTASPLAFARQAARNRAGG